MSKDEKKIPPTPASTPTNGVVDVPVFENEYLKAVKNSLSDEELESMAG